MQHSKTVAYSETPDSSWHMVMSGDRGVTRDQLLVLADPAAPPSNTFVRELLTSADETRVRDDDRVLIAGWSDRDGYVADIHMVGWPVLLVEVAKFSHSAGRFGRIPQPHDYAPIHMSSISLFHARYLNTGAHVTSSHSLYWTGIAPWILIAVAIGRVARYASIHGQTSAAKIHRVTWSVVMAACLLSMLLSFRQTSSFRPSGALDTTYRADGRPREASLRDLAARPDADNQLARFLLQGNLLDPPQIAADPLMVMLASEQRVHRRSLVVQNSSLPLMLVTQVARSSNPLPRTDSWPQPPAAATSHLPYSAAGPKVTLFRNGYLNPRIDLPTRAGDTHLRSIELNVSLICGYIVFLLAAFHLPRWLIHRLRRRAARRRHRRGLCAACAYPRPAAPVAAAGC